MQIFPHDYGIYTNIDELEKQNKIFVPYVYSAKLALTREITENTLDTSSNYIMALEHLI